MNDSLVLDTDKEHHIMLWLTLVVLISNEAFPKLCPERIPIFSSCVSSLYLYDHFQSSKWSKQKEISLGINTDKNTPLWSSLIVLDHL